MIYTGNYENCKELNNFVSISKDGGKSVNFKGKKYYQLSPKLEFFKKWKENIGKITEEENIRFYIEHYYNEVLKDLDISELLTELGTNFIMGCYEKSDDFCHRFIVANYLELVLGINIDEIKVKDGKIITLPKSKMYKKIGNILCETIIKDIDSQKKRKEKTMILL